MLDNLNELPDWISRGLEDLFPYNHSEDSDQSFIKRLELSSIEKKPLRVKLGIDPTGTDIHIGHSILFRKLRAFQDAGHTAVLIIGDFTARIGDPTGKSKTRVQLSTEQVELNAVNYLEQLGSDYGKFDREGKVMFIDNMENLMERYKVFMKRFELSEDFQAKMTVEQLKTQLGHFGIPPDQMFDQMNKTLERMKSELDK